MECKQILNALGWEVREDGLLHETEPYSIGLEVTDGVVGLYKGKPKGWVNHPCTKMWKGYEKALAQYQRVMIMEWQRRGYTNTMLYVSERKAKLPPWADDERVYASHRSNLLRKLPDFYGKYGWTEPHDLPYFYPEPA